MRGRRRHHVIYRPATPEGFFLGVAEPIEHTFLLSAELRGEPVAGADAWLRYVDFPVRALVDVVVLAARCYLHVPSDILIACRSAEIEIADQTPWPETGRSAHADMEFRIRPVDVSDGLPRGLECVAALRVNGVPCGTGRARLLFRPADVRSRTVMSQPGAESERWRNAVDFGADLLVADGAEEICGLSLLSASADAVMRAVNRLVSFDVRHCALVRWTVELYDVDDVTRDLTCAVTVGHVARDRNGWPLVPATVDYRACSRPIGRVTTRVLQHC